MITPERAKFRVDCNRVMAMYFGIFCRGKSTRSLPENPISRMGPLAQLGFVAPQSLEAVVSRYAERFAKTQPHRAASRLPSAPPLVILLL